MSHTSVVSRYRVEGSPLASPPSAGLSSATGSPAEQGEIDFAYRAPMPDARQPTNEVHFARSLAALSFAVRPSARSELISVRHAFLTAPGAWLGGSSTRLSRTPALIGGQIVSVLRCDDDCARMVNREVLPLLERCETVFDFSSIGDSHWSRAGLEDLFSAATAVSTCLGFVGWAKFFRHLDRSESFEHCLGGAYGAQDGWKERMERLRRSFQKWDASKYLSSNDAARLAF